MHIFRNLFRTMAATVLSFGLGLSLGTGAMAATIVLPGSQPVIDFPGHASTHLLKGDATPSDVALFEFVVPPKSFGAPPHIHQDEDEFGYIIEGELTLLNEDGTTSKAPAGSAVALPRGHLHGFWNETDKPVKMLFGISPSNFETFFDAVVQRLRAENPEPGPEIGRIIGETAATYNTTVYPEKVPEHARQYMK